MPGLCSNRSRQHLFGTKGSSKTSLFKSKKEVLSAVILKETWFNFQCTVFFFCLRTAEFLSMFIEIDLTWGTYFLAYLEIFLCVTMLGLVLNVCKNACFIFYWQHWFCCHWAFSFGSHSGDKNSPSLDFCVLIVEGSKAISVTPVYLKMTHKWLHLVAPASEVTQTCCVRDAMFVVWRWPPLPLISALILPSSPLPNTRAVCHGWFGNKMRKVLSQRQKSPFHLAPCHPTHTSGLTQMLSFRYTFRITHRMKAL